MASATPQNRTQWDSAGPDLRLTGYAGDMPQGALIPSAADEIDQIAVVYMHGERPPEITIRQVSRKVQAVLANGVAVAVVARATGPDLTVDDILLVERYVG